jgi:hypothetical protein
MNTTLLWLNNEQNYVSKFYFIPFFKLGQKAMIPINGRVSAR